MSLLEAIPALPVADIQASLRYYQHTLGFATVHAEATFAIVKRDVVEIHLWAAYDQCWRGRGGASPVVSGAESFLAGTASCRVAVAGIEALYEEMRSAGALHAEGNLTLQWWGDRDFAVVDLDRNLITFFERG